MELLDGETLNQRIAKAQLPTDEILDLAKQVAEGLNISHSEGIIHRDIKPANLFITKHGHAKILDCGLAKLVQESPGATSAMPTAQATGELITSPGSVIGTIAHMSPEQALAKELDARTDLFSFGIAKAIRRYSISAVR